jgi:Zn-dependent peptidase ImmA (M78 family)/DNA-binding XRE family transcriptional regulator
LTLGGRWIVALTRLPVQPAVIRWARETAGLDVATAAARIGVKPDRVEAWEGGSLAPTIKQLRGMADVYARPLAALFMQEPLLGDVQRDLPDFRRQEARSHVVSRALQKAMMRAYRQRDALRDVAEELELPDSAVNPRFALDPHLATNILGSRLRSALRMDAISKSVLLQPEALLRELVKRAEELSVTVIQVQRVEVSEMRGFSLGDGTCPIVALNGADWPRGKVYTLVHELAHVGFRSNGLCDLQRTQDAAVERQCDAIAADVLMPASLFLAAIGPVRADAITTDLARAVGNEFGASGEAALLRMVELGRATWDDYRRLKPEFDRVYATFKADERQRNAGKDSPIFYQVKARDLGRRFIRQMASAHQQDALSSRDLAQLLEVTYDKVPKLVGLAGEDVGSQVAVQVSIVDVLAPRMSARLDLAGAGWWAACRRG